MPFCPKCKFEYTTGETECIDCGVPLLDELPGDGPTDTDEEHFVPFRRYRSRVYAEVVRESLANEGIKAVIRGVGIAEESSQQVDTPAGEEAVLWIPEDEMEQARTIADSIVREI